MEKSMLTEVKAILKSLVLSCPEKITVEQLNRDYRDVEGQFIPFRQLGFGNLEQFLRSVPDTLRVFGNGPTAMVCFVANEKSDHIHDMIMRQKKPKPKTRSRPGSAGRNKSNAFHGSSSRKPIRVSGQQLSPYQSVNRNQTTKTLQVKPFPWVAQPMPQVVTRPNYPTPLVDQMIYNLPQPNGILLNSAVCAIQNGIIKPFNVQDQLYQNKVNQLNSSLKTQCCISMPPPPLPRSLNRNVSFPAEKKCVIQVEATKITETQAEKMSNIKIYQKTETKTSPIQFKPPKAKKQVSMKLPEKVENMPKLSKVSNQIIEAESDNLSTKATEKPGNIQSDKKTQPKTFFDISSEYAEDPDEAIPSFAAKSNVFRLDFPEYTVSYGNKIEPYKLPDEITVGSCLKIFITEIHSPFKFWFNLYKENHELDILMNQIERYYSNMDSEDLCIPRTCLTPGQVCAALYNGLWHRAEIVAPPVNKSIKVSFMDYGTVAEVEIESVKFLATFFARLPSQAIRGCLSHIKPCEYHWSHEATRHFLMLVEELLLYAKITEIDKENNVIYMILCDTNADKVVQINSSLVENRYAFYNEDWKTEKIKQNNGKRVRHPREDFPTFSMIESGEYPSFKELVNMQQRGVDYETIYDIVIFNQSSILNKHECASEGLKQLPYFLTTSNPFRSEILSDLNAATSKVI